MAKLGLTIIYKRTHWYYILLAINILGFKTLIPFIKNKALLKPNYAKAKSILVSDIVAI